MDKKQKEESLCVEYKGQELILQPGHKVFELDIKTGQVSEYKLKRKIDLESVMKRKKKYKVDCTDKNKMHVPAYNIEKARIKFKQVVKSLGIKIYIRES